eukprot:maker-scaffold273_size229271-snap-gene-1.20 protein:Tk00749 transcript:maker-scaffold273_size229271-snap-gene-1.20-mRNA-1 annotation:"PREDICTED: paraplegin"
MTCTTSNGSFKGVVVTSCGILMIIGLCQALSVQSHREGKTLQDNVSATSMPYCVYLAQSQELDCVCSEERVDGSEDEILERHFYSEPVTFPSEEYIHNAENNSVASVKLHSCSHLHLKLDLRILERPFYRLRVEDVQRVIVDGITLLPKDMVDIWFRNVNVSLDLVGGVNCAGCGPAMNHSDIPQLNVHVLDNTNITFRDLYVNNVHAKIKIRNAEQLLIQDSYFYSMPKDSVEVFNVPNVTIHHSEFHRTTNSSLLLNRVRNFSIHDSLMMRTAVEVLSNDTISEWKCTISPLESAKDIFSPEELAMCATGRFFQVGAESKGAIVLAVISAVILILALTILFLLHRAGKLEHSVMLSTPRMGGWRRQTWQWGLRAFRTTPVGGAGAGSTIVLRRAEVIACLRLFHRSQLDAVRLLGGANACPPWGLRGFHTSSPWQDSDPKPDREKEDREKKIANYKFGFFLAVALSLGLLSSSSSNTPPPREVNWNDFYQNMLLAGEVSHISIIPLTNHAQVELYKDAIYKGQRTNNPRFTLSIPEDTNLEDRVREAEAQLGIPAGQGVSITYERSVELTSAIFSAVVGVMIISAVYFLSRRFMGSSGGGMANPFTRLTKADFTLIDPQMRTGQGVKFTDVAGLKEAKIEVKEFVDYLKHPEKYSELGAKPPKGAILYGPPGCGKTMLAKAVANESNVPFLQMNGSEFIEMIGGLGAARVRNLFAEARKRSPSIIYIDEIDAIGRQRGGGGSGAGGMGGGGEMEQTLNQMLVEMDGIASKEGVIMLASTNRSDVLDQALLRPGRFDRKIEIDLPSLIERKEILEHHMKGVVMELAPTAYSDRLATLTPGFSGADLANLVNEAALHAAREKCEHVGRSNFEYAIERVIAGPEKKTSVLNPVERKVVAYHEAGHALVGWMLQHTDALLKVTILPRTSMALGFAQYTPMDKKLFSPEELMDRMCMALGGRVAESLTFNRITTGAQSDLDKVTKMAYAQIRQYGFNPTVGHVSFEDTGGKRPYSKKLAATMDMEARQLIARSYKITEGVLQTHKDKLTLMAEELLKRETLNYDDVVALLGEPPFGKKNLVSPADFEKQLKEQANTTENSEKK